MSSSPRPSASWRLLGVCALLISTLPHPASASDGDALCSATRLVLGGNLLAAIKFPPGTSYVEIRANGRRIASVGRRCSDSATRARCEQAYRDAASAPSAARELVAEHGARFERVGSRELASWVGRIDTGETAALAAVLAGYQLEVCEPKKAEPSANAQREPGGWRVAVRHPERGAVHVSRGGRVVFHAEGRD